MIVLVVASVAGHPVGIPAFLGCRRLRQALRGLDGPAAATCCCSLGFPFAGRTSSPVGPAGGRGAAAKGRERARQVPAREGAATVCVLRSLRTLPRTILTVPGLSGGRARTGRCDSSHPCPLGVRLLPVRCWSLARARRARCGWSAVQRSVGAGRVPAAAGQGGHLHGGLISVGSSAHQAGVGLLPEEGSDAR